MGIVQTFSCFWVLFPAFLSTHGTVLAPASATAGRFLRYSSAPGTMVGPSATAGCMGTTDADPAGADETGDPKAGQQLL